MKSSHIYTSHCDLSNMQTALGGERTEWERGGKPHKNLLIFFSLILKTHIFFLSLMFCCTAILCVFFFLYFFFLLFPSFVVCCCFFCDFAFFCASHIKYAIDRRSVELLQIIYPQPHTNADERDIRASKMNAVKCDWKSINVRQSFISEKNENVLLKLN